MSKARSASIGVGRRQDPSLFDALQTPIDRAASRGSDRRVHARLTPVELQNPITARLKDGEAVTLVDLSAGGALLETSMFLRPDTDLVLELVDPRTRDVTDVVTRVLRSQVSGLQGESRPRRLRLRPAVFASGAGRSSHRDAPPRLTTPVSSSSH